MNTDPEQEVMLTVRNQPDDRTWKSCCLVINKYAVVFFAQLSITLIVMSFSIYMLLNSTSCEHDAMYSGLLSMCIGVWIKSPSISKK